jgi:hypothetical protein
MRPPLQDMPACHAGSSKRLNIETRLVGCAFSFALESNQVNG